MHTELAKCKIVKNFFLNLENLKAEQNIDSTDQIIFVNLQKDDSNNDGYKMNFSPNQFSDSDFLLKYKKLSDTYDKKTFTSKYLETLKQIKQSLILLETSPTSHISSTSSMLETLRNTKLNSGSEIYKEENDQLKFETVKLREEIDRLRGKNDELSEELESKVNSFTFGGEKLVRKNIILDHENSRLLNELKDRNNELRTKREDLRIAREDLRITREDLKTFHGLINKTSAPITPFPITPTPKTSSPNQRRNRN
jgi:FtsZ-binding cell division protein ZapB